MKRNLEILLAVLIGGIISLSVMANSAIADVPPLMSYQGKLTDATGAPVSDGDYCMEFKIYDSATDGNVLWQEAHPSVSVLNGLFKVLLGGYNNPIPDTVFCQPDRWLGVKICTDPEEMSPRRRIVSVGYTFKAAKAQTADTADYAHNSDNLDGFDSSSFIRLLGYYNSGWFSIDLNERKTKAHGLSLDIENDSYLVFLYGKNSDGVHQVHYGTEYGNWGTVANKWAGAQWYKLTTDSITVARAANDDQPDDDQKWYDARVIILKIQSP